MNKTVLYPIKVPDCDYCCESNSPFRICGYFCNEGGYHTCELVCNWNLEATKDGVLKAPECAKLAEEGENK